MMQSQNRSRLFDNLNSSGILRLSNNIKPMFIRKVYARFLRRSMVTKCLVWSEEIIMNHPSIH